MSETAKRMQAQFTALAHNLMLLLEAKANREEGIRDEKVEKKYVRELERRAQEASRHGHRFRPMIMKPRRRATQISFQFIRWLRNHLAIGASYRESLPALRRAMVAYL